MTPFRNQRGAQVSFAWRKGVVTVQSAILTFQLCCSEHVGRAPSSVSLRLLLASSFFCLSFFLSFFLLLLLRFLLRLLLLLLASRRALQEALFSIGVGKIWDRSARELPRMKHVLTG